MIHVLLWGKNITLVGEEIRVVCRYGWKVKEKRFLKLKKRVFFSLSFILLYTFFSFLLLSVILVYKSFFIFILQSFIQRHIAGDTYLTVDKNGVIPQFNLHYKWFSTHYSTLEHGWIIYCELFLLYWLRAHSWSFVIRG